MTRTPAKAEGVAAGVLDRDPLVVSREFQKLGDSFGKELIERLQQRTRRLVQDLAVDLEGKLLSLWRTGGAAPQRGGPQAPALLGRIEAQLHAAAREWKQLRRELDAIRQGWANETFERIFGGGGGDASGAPASDPGALPCAGGQPPADAAAAAAAGMASLEAKLDELLTLVREQVGRQRRPEDAGEIPPAWTQWIARDVARRLRDSAPLAQEPPRGAASAPAAGGSEGDPIASRRRISLDDVAAMVEQITGGKGSR
jgi:hypothetical protein